MQILEPTYSSHDVRIFWTANLGFSKIRISYFWAQCYPPAWEAYSCSPGQAIPAIHGHQKYVTMFKTACTVISQIESIFSICISLTPASILPPPVCLGLQSSPLSVFHTSILYAFLIFICILQALFNYAFIASTGTTS